MTHVLDFVVNEKLGDPVSPIVLKLARQLMDLTQADLAKHAGVSLRSLVEIEKQERQPMRATLERLRISLESQGATFFADADKMGVYVAKTPNVSMPSSASVGAATRSRRSKAAP